MTTALRYRLFGIGKMPPALRTLSKSPDVLLSAEGVSLKISGRSVALPGVRSFRSAQLAVGSIVLSPARVMASYGAWTVLDTDLADGADTAHELTLSTDGVHLHVSVPAIYEGGRGTYDLHYRTDIKPTILTQLPSTPRAVDLPQGIAALARRWA